MSVWRRAAPPPKRGGGRRRRGPRVMGRGMEREKKPAPAPAPISPHAVRKKTARPSEMLPACGSPVRACEGGGWVWVRAQPRRPPRASAALRAGLGVRTPEAGEWPEPLCRPPRPPVPAQRRRVNFFIFVGRHPLSPLSRKNNHTHRRGDHDLRAGPQGDRLCAQAQAAHHQGDPDVRELRQLAHHARDLDRQFPGGREDEAVRGRQVTGAVEQAFQEGQREGGGLAGAGDGGAGDVPAQQGERDAGGLFGGRGLARDGEMM